MHRSSQSHDKVRKYKSDIRSSSRLVEEAYTFHSTARNYWIAVKVQATKVWLCLSKEITREVVQGTQCRSQCKSLGAPCLYLHGCWEILKFERTREKHSRNANWRKWFISTEIKKKRCACWQPAQYRIYRMTLFKESTHCNYYRLERSRDNSQIGLFTLRRQ